MNIISANKETQTDVRTERQMHRHTTHAFTHRNQYHPSIYASNHTTDTLRASKDK